MRQFCLVFILFCGVTLGWAGDDRRQKIILDTDMVELFDDGIVGKSSGYRIIGSYCGGR